jgi:hypothetical protein
MHAAVTACFTQNTHNCSKNEPNGIVYPPHPHLRIYKITFGHNSAMACENHVPSQWDSAGPSSFHRTAQRWPNTMKRTKIMKRILLASVLALSAGTAVYADSMSGALNTGVALEVSRLVPTADVSSLSRDQIIALENLFSNSENLRSGNDPAGEVRRILSQF